MALHLLPTELLLWIIEYLPRQGDLNALACTTARLWYIVNPILYKKNLISCEDVEIMWRARKRRTFRAFRYNGTTSALVWAVKSDVHETLRICLEAGANIPKTDLFNSHLLRPTQLNGMTVIPRNPLSHPLVIAATKGSVSCVRLLLDHGVYPDFVDDNYETPMREAAANGHVEVIKALLKWDPKVFCGPFRLRRPIQLAAARGHLAVLKVFFKFLKSRPVTLSIKVAAMIVLYQGLWHNQPEVVQYAFSKGADPNNTDINPVLLFASDPGPKESAIGPRKILIKADRGDHSGWYFGIRNTLHAAAANGEDFLRSANPTSYLGSFGQERLVRGVWDTKLALVRLLLKHGADLDVLCENYPTRSWVASVQDGDIESFLLRSGVVDEKEIQSLKKAIQLGAMGRACQIMLAQPVYFVNKE